MKREMGTGEETMGAYHLHGKPGNSGWKTKGCSSFYLEQYRSYGLPVEVMFCAITFAWTTNFVSCISVLLLISFTFQLSAEARAPCGGKHRYSSHCLTTRL